MKLSLNRLMIVVSSILMSACATHSKNDWVNNLRTWEYDIHSHQPACYVTTTRHASGAVLGQVTQCPPVQYYCTLTSTGERITCPKFDKNKFNEDYAMLEDAHYKEDCRLVREHNYTYYRDKPKSSWHTIMRPEKNPYCNLYGEPK